MAKVKVEVTGGVVNGSPKGSQINLEEKDADYLESIGYVKKVAQQAPKKEAPTKTAKVPTKDNPVGADAKTASKSTKDK